MNAINPVKPEWAQSRRERERAVLEAAGLGRRRRRWPWLLLLLALLAGAGFALWQFAEGNLSLPIAEEANVATPAETVDVPRPVMQVLPEEVGRVAPQDLRRTVRVTGLLTPSNKAEVSSEVAGRLELVTVRPGDSVVAGEVVAQIDVEALRIQRDQQGSTADATRAQLELAQRQLERVESLAGRGVSTQSALDEARANVAQLRASLASLEAQVASAEYSLEKAIIPAPISGVVATRLADPGQFVATGAPIVTIADISSLELQAFAPVSAGAQIEVGQRVIFRVDGAPDRQFEGVVDRISPVAAEGTRSIPVFISLENPDGLLRGGMFATGEIVIEERMDAIVLPATALREDGAGSYVLRLDGQRVLRQPVEPGPEWDGGRLVEIVSGVSEGDLIVTAALPGLEPEDRIAMLEVSQ